MSRENIINVIVTFIVIVIVNISNITKTLLMAHRKDLMKKCTQTNIATLASRSCFARTHCAIEVRKNYCAIEVET